MRSTWILPTLLVALLVIFRAITAGDFLPNFSPLPALFLCSLIFLRGAKAWLLPVAAWAITDPIVSALQGAPALGWHHLGIALGLAASVGLGLFLRRRPSAPVVLVGSLAAAVLFYLMANTVSFVVDPLYPKTLTGFVQAQWTGPVGFGPTWVFLRNLAAGNLAFTALFLAARHAWVPRTMPAPAADKAAAAAR